MTSKKQIEYSAKYNKNNTLMFNIRLNINYDKDIIEYLETVPSKAGLVKALIREHMAREGE